MCSQAGTGLLWLAYASSLEHWAACYSWFMRANLQTGSTPQNYHLTAPDTACIAASTSAVLQAGAAQHASDSLHDADCMPYRKVYRNSFGAACTVWTFVLEAGAHRS